MPKINLKKYDFDIIWVSDDQYFLNEQAKNNKKSILFFDLTDCNKKFYD